MRPPPKAWTPEDTSLALKLWNEAVPASQIAKVLDRTRNGIIGRMHRIGAPLSPLLTMTKAERKRKKKVRPKMVLIKPAPPEPPKPMVTEEGVTIFDLEYGMCKWLLPNNHYCGQSAVAFNKPYCTSHSAIARRHDEKRTVQLRPYQR